MKAMLEDPEFQSLLSRYTSMDTDDFEALCLRAAQSPDSMTAAASMALMEAATQRGTTFAEAVGRALEDREADRRLMKAMADAEQSKKDRALRREEVVLGYLGLSVGVVLLVLGLNAGHTGGSVAGAATVACSLWMVYPKRKD